MTYLWFMVQYGEFTEKYLWLLIWRDLKGSAKIWSQLLIQTHASKSRGTQMNMMNWWACLMVKHWSQYNFFNCWNHREWVMERRMIADARWLDAHVDDVEINTRGKVPEKREHMREAALRNDEGGTVVQWLPWRRSWGWDECKSPRVGFAVLSMQTKSLPFVVSHKCAANCSQTEQFRWDLDNNKYGGRSELMVSFD